MFKHAKPDASPCPLSLQNGRLICLGDWTITHFQQIKRLWQNVNQDTIQSVDAQQVQSLDTAGAYLLLQIQQQCPHATLILSTQQQTVVTLVQRFKIAATPIQKAKPSFITQFGQSICAAASEAVAYIAFIGELSTLTLTWLLQPKRILWQTIWQTVQRTGFEALGIVGLLSFLIGIVLAYQMGGQLQSYGASIYIVSLLGVSILREFGPLITAIIVAGRSGSAFAASLGTMQVNQEIDALKTLGVSPTERLALGKIIGLVIALPLLVVWADFTAILGGIIMAKFQLGLSPAVYIDQFHSSVGINQFWLGLMKTPAFAVLIASIGCFQGFLVKGGADSVGQQTTRSVVQAIFLIIVADAFFSIIMSAFHA